MVYNLTAITTNTTGLLGFVQGVNTVLMGGWLGSLILLGFSVLMLITFYHTTQDFNKSLAGTSFISFSIALSLRAVELVPPLAVYITLIITGATIAFMWKSN